MAEEPDHHQLLHPVRRRRERQDRWDREGERSMAQNLALIGVLGWLVVMPTLAGVFLGRWLDRMSDGGIFWTASLLFCGLALGCWMAWRRMHES